MSQSNDTSFADYLDRYTFEYILQQMLNKIPDTLDKREGSIIWDALAPAAVELSKMFLELKSILINTYAATATGNYLDLRVQERGMSRKEATFAVKKAVFIGEDGLPVSIPIGARFSTVGDENPLNFTVTAVYEESGIEQAGEYELTCETAGTVGNSYIGNLLPISNLPNLKSATMEELLIPARNKETDDELYDRYLEKINVTSFGGNIAQYREWILNIAGVGAVQVYPVWNGGGSVKTVILGTDFNLASSELISNVQELIDPTPQGEGLGQAPIGHTVTVATATAKSIDIGLDLVSEADYTPEQIKTLVTPILNDYLLSIRKDWDRANDFNVHTLNIFRANIIAAVIVLPQILNITNVTLNGKSQDLSLTENAQLQELPVLGEVVINVQ